MSKNHRRTSYPSNNQSAWHTGDEGPKECKSCSYSEERQGYAIRIHPDVFAAIFRLCEVVKEEWQMLLRGAVHENVVFVNGYYIPKQVVSSASVKNLEAIDREFIEENDIVATIHSHSNMGVFFSSVDDECTNMSFIQHHIVVNNKQEFVAKSRIDLPCDMVKFVTSKVETLIPTSPVLVGEDKIEIRRFTAFPHEKTYGGWRGGEYVGYDREDTNGRESWMNESYVKDKRGIWVHKATLSDKDREELGVAHDDFGHAY